MVVSGENNDVSQSSKKRKVLLLLLGLVAIGLVVVWILLIQEPVEPVDGVVVAEPMVVGNEATRIPEEDIDSDDIAAIQGQVPEGGGGGSVQYSPQATIHRSSEVIDIQFANPNDSSSPISIQLEIGGRILGESEIIPVGYHVDHLRSTTDLSDLSLGDYDGRFLVTHYDPITQEPAQVGVELEIEVTVMD